jgi:electron transfer flavoprotein beta subunit
MDIAVLVKHVPNRGGDPPEIDDDVYRLRRDQPEAGLDPSDEPGVELAVQLCEAYGGEVTVFSMGPEAALHSVWRALAIGAHRGVLVSDVLLEGADSLVTARALAASIRRRPFDLVIAGVESTDAATGTMPMTLAALLGLPSVTFARKVSLDGSCVTIERQTSNGHDVIECPLPALVTVTGAVAEPRYPSLRETIRAKSKPVERLSLSDVDIGPGDVHATHHVVSIDLAPEREAGEIVEDASLGVRRILEMLREARVLQS